jgi:hypothetical protein
MNLLTGNKGDWSELYVFFKLIADGKVHLGDAEKNIINEAYYTIEKIVRACNDSGFSYTPAGEFVKITSSLSTYPLFIEMSKFKEAANTLFDSLNSHVSGTYSNATIQEFMFAIGCTSISAPSTTKTDITLVIHDEQVNTSSELGFSIKSELGSASSLFNASGSTKIRYVVDFIDFERHHETINEQRDLSGMVSKIFELGGNISHHSVLNHTFANNLELIDGNLTVIISTMLLESYKRNQKNLSDLIAVLEEVNPCNFQLGSGHPFYSSKIKHFLLDVALGMTAGSVWDCVYQAAGGYLLVKRNGDVLCYHVYNKVKFENYLLANTKLDTPSTTRHNFGKIFTERGQTWLDLNLQIRFK